jgi:AcrR family transcriptional regulator
MCPVATRRPGRPAAASREDALALARRRFLQGRRVDVQAIARELGLARATMHRWFGTREQLLGEMLAELGERRLQAIRAGIDGVGAAALLRCFDAYNSEIASSPGLAALLANEQERALRVLTSSGGIVQPRTVAAIQRLIDAELESGAFVSPISSPTLAYAIVRLAESFLYNDAIVGLRGEQDAQRLREVEAALLGLSDRN